MEISPYPRNAVYLGLILAGLLLPVGQLSHAATEQATASAQPALPALMLARDWQATLNPADFLVSEKLDGVRAHWDGQALRFRGGGAIAAPAWFTDGLPKLALDGELWMGRRSFDRLSGAVRKAVPSEADWREVRYRVFDLPGAPGNFAERSQRLLAVAAQINVTWLVPVQQLKVPDQATLRRLLNQVAQDGGEGLVLHRADAQWQAGRSDALRKLKLQPDEDAKVVAHIAGKGRNAGRMGALVLELPDGQQFTLGTGFSDAQREQPPAVGTLVTYRYRDRTPKGLPKFASFLRTRSAE